MSKHPVCDLKDLPEGSHVVRQITDRMSVGVYNVDGRIVAFRNHCPHAGAPVCEGKVGGAILCDKNFERHLAHEGKILRCPWHAWEFLLPEGITLTKPAFRLLSHPVVIEDGQIFVQLAPSPAAATTTTTTSAAAPKSP